MSWKPIEMQVALPRTQDAGQMQYQLMHKPVADQTELGHSAEKKLERERTQSTKVDETSGRIIDEQDQDRPGHQEKKRKKKKGDSSSNNQGKSLEHPYKGHHIDLSL